ncbi:hypothetical protein V6N13_080772 [Hibiscus sabdariffa]
MECRKFALVMVAMAVVLSTATTPTVTAARNGAMPFSIITEANIRNPFVGIFSVEKSAENCVLSGTVDGCSECCDPNRCVNLLIYPPRGGTEGGGE